MADLTPIPEPPDGTSWLIGEPPVQAYVVRDDASASAVRDQDPYRSVADDARWFPADSENDGPYVWSEITGPYVGHEDMPIGIDGTKVARLFTQAEVHRLAAEAKATAGLTPVGEHLIEPGGYCRSCGVKHSPEEIARAEDRLAEEGSDA